MEKILIALLMMMSFSCTVIAIDSEVTEDNQEQNDFWPPDMIPHPNPPWHKPKKPSDPDLAVVKSLLNNPWDWS